MGLFGVKFFLCIGARVTATNNGCNQSTHPDYNQNYNWHKGDCGIIISYMGLCELGRRKGTNRKAHVYKIQKDNGEICLVRPEGFKLIVS